MINKDSDFFRISTKLNNEKRIVEKKIGQIVKKTNYENYIKYDYLTLLVNNFSLRFLEQNKEERREFIDFFLFHVKQDHLVNLKDLKKFFIPGIKL